MSRRSLAPGRLLVPALAVFGLNASDRPPAAPEGLPPLSWPASNPYSPAKARLGRYLYFDKRLSADETVSCATCHDPRHAFTDGAPVSTGIHGQKGERSAPTILNRAYALAQFWDGRAPTLEEQAKGPMVNPLEMGNTHAAIVARLESAAGYRPLFAKAFGDARIDIDRVVMAIATFERTVLSGNAPYDRYKRGDHSALTPEQVQGMELFFNKARCDRCHEGSNFTLNAYANEGIGTDKPEPDAGRFAVTKDARDWGAFKIPTLREIEYTAPYMHDGSLKTLEEVIEFYDKGGIANRNLDPNLRPLHLTPAEKHALVAFLKSLSGEGWRNVHPPEEFPQ